MLCCDSVCSYTYLWCTILMLVKLEDPDACIQSGPCQDILKPLTHHKLPHNSTHASPYAETNAQKNKAAFVAQTRSANGASQSTPIDVHRPHFRSPTSGSSRANEPGIALFTVGPHSKNLGLSGDRQKLVRSRPLFVLLPVPLHQTFQRRFLLEYVCRRTCIQGLGC